MKLIGLTGGIACGKSTVAGLLRDAGLDVVDADEVAHAVQQKGRWGYRRVVKEFGSGILDADGNIDRAALGELAFRDAGARRRLNRATHVPIGVELARRVLGCVLRGHFTVVLDMPLLYESGSDRFMRLNVVVEVPREVQLARLIARDGCSRELAQAKVGSQIPAEEKAARADIIIDNSGSLDDTRAQVADAVARIRASRWRPWGGKGSTAQGGTAARAAT